MRRRKEKGRLIECLREIVNDEDASEGTGKRIAEFLGVPDRAKESFFLTLPIKKLQAAVKKFSLAQKT